MFVDLWKLASRTCDALWAQGRKKMEDDMVISFSTVKTFESTPSRWAVLRWLWRLGFGEIAVLCERCDYLECSYLPGGRSGRGWPKKN